MVLLAHGSGLNGCSWAPVGEHLSRGGFRPIAIDFRGHGASERSPDGDYDWELFASDVLAVVDQFGLAGGRVPAAGHPAGALAAGHPAGALAAGHPAGALAAGHPAGALAAGHSAGATALLLAEARRPGTFASLWAWEPIMSVPPGQVRVERSAELASRARRRRSHFGSLDEARSHYAGRGIFADFDPAAFEAFLGAALVPAAGTAGPGSGAGSSPAGYVLACDPEDEARIYEASGTHDAWRALGAVRCPVRVLGGALSPAVPPGDVGAIAGQLPAGQAVIVPGLGHFGPFQAPAAIARDILGWAQATHAA